MKEWEVQKKLYEQLTNNGYPCYSDKQRPNGGWHPKTFKGDKNRPDLIFFIPQKLQFCNTSKKCERTTLPTPIGVELKIAASFNEITKGIINQIDRRYVKNEYEIQEQNWKGTLPIILFATDNGLETGYVDRYSGNRKNYNPRHIHGSINYYGKIYRRKRRKRNEI